MKKTLQIIIVIFVIIGVGLFIAIIFTSVDNLFLNIIGFEYYDNIQNNKGIIMMASFTLSGILFSQLNRIDKKSLYEEQKKTERSKRYNEAKRTRDKKKYLDKKKYKEDRLYREELETLRKKKQY